MKNTRGPNQNSIIITEEANKVMDRREKRFRRRLQIYIAALLGAGVLSFAPSQAAAQLYDERYISDFNGSNGFRLTGVGQNDASGNSVSGAGDINGDGFADFIIGAKRADSVDGNFLIDAGASYVVFGKASGFGDAFSLASLDGTNGFRLNGTGPGNYSGTSVSSAGDINGDGFGDIIVGTPNAADNGSRSGASYVVLGKASGFNASVDLNSLAAPDGFRLLGGSGPRSGEWSGASVSGAGDINADGLDDIIIGAPRAEHNGNSSGAGYVVFGKQSGFSSSINLSDMTPADGFRIDGNPRDNLGNSVAGAGDVNGDGFDDIIIGAYRGTSIKSGISIYTTGAAYVVFGKGSGFTASIKVSDLTGLNGFRVNGNKLNDRFGYSVSGAGDINGDGFADVIMGAPLEDRNDLRDCGITYVLFGKASGFVPVRDVSELYGGDGFRVLGGEKCGFSVSSAGDVNGDGYADINLGSPETGTPVSGTGGSSAVAYGKASGFQNLFFHYFHHTEGYTLYGFEYGDGVNDQVGHAVSGVGDVNGDGFGDNLVGASGAGSNGAAGTGASFVSFGTGPVSGSTTFRGYSRPGDAPPVKPGSVGDGSVRPNAARARIDFTAGTTVSQEIVTLSRGTSGTVTGIDDEDTADAVWQITTDRARFTTAVVTLTYLNSEVERVTNVAAESESSLTMYKSESSSGPWIPLPTTVNAAKNEAAAPVTTFGYFLLGAPPRSSVGHWDLY